MTNKTAMQKIVEILTEEHLLTHESWQGIFEDLIAEEKMQITKAVNDTIAACHYYTESPHNPLPMNGGNYYETNYQKNTPCTIPEQTT